MNVDRDPSLQDIPRNRLYRNSQKGVIFGVCAGIADYFGFDLTVTRVLVALAAVFFLGPLIPIAYLLLALLLKKDPRPERHDADDPAVRIQRTVRAEPHATLNTVRHRFRELDSRMQRLEKYVTSERFKLDREFERLGE